MNKLTSEKCKIFIAELEALPANKLRDRLLRILYTCSRFFREFPDAAIVLGFLWSGDE